METQSRGPPARRCSGARGRVASGPEAGWPRSRHRLSETRPCNARWPPLVEVERDRRLRPLNRSKKSAGATPGAVGPLGGLDLDDGCARPGQQVAAERPGPQSREVDHQEIRRVRRGGASPRTVAHPARRGPHPAGRPAGRAARLSPSAEPIRCQCSGQRRTRAGSVAGKASSSSHAGTSSLSSSRGRDTARNPSARRGQRQLPPQLVAPRRQSPIRAARSPRRASASSRSKRLRAVDALHESVGWAEWVVDDACKGHQAARRPALHWGLSMAQGNV